MAGDAATPQVWWDNVPFERILLDAPCSGTGVIRRHPDIKLLRSENDITQLAELQFQLLSALWPLLACGGVLLYATCSVMPEENTRVLERFLAATDNARELPMQGEIEFRGLNFSYNGKPVLRDLNLRIPAGSSLAIVGPTGSGN